MPHVLNPCPGSFQNYRLAEGKSAFFTRAFNQKLRGEKKHNRIFNDRNSFKSTYDHGRSLEEPDLVEAALSFVQFILT